MKGLTNQEKEVSGRLREKREKIREEGHIVHMQESLNPGENFRLPQRSLTTGEEDCVT